MKTVTVKVPLPLVQAFLKMSEMIDQDMSNAGCNDFPLPNNPENRELYDECERRRLNVKTIDELRKHEDYSPPKKSGSLGFFDQDLFGYFVECMQTAVK